MITYTNMTPSQTLEDRIVSTINAGVDATATKIVCVTDGNLLRINCYFCIFNTIN